VSIVRFTPPPGITNNGTDYTQPGTWHDCDKVRFRGGFPQKIGGWIKYSTNEFLGTCRCLHGWVDLSGNKHTAIGTHLKLYADTNGSYADITPIRATATLGLDPLDTTSGESLIVINDVGHGAVAGDFVTVSGATATGGLTTGDLNAEFQIVEVIDADSYTVDTGATASSTASGGGAAVDVEYQITVGADSRAAGLGWGAGAWSREGWGEVADIAVAGTQLTLWSADNIGENLIANTRGGGIYYWPANFAGRATLLSAAAGAAEVPTICNLILVSGDDRRVFAFGVNPIGSATQDPLLLRWSDVESFDFDPASSDASTAGEALISSGSEIITALKARDEILVWTDKSLHGLSFIGGNDAYSIRVISPNIDIVGPKSAVAVDDFVMWMGRQNFYLYNGRAVTIPCTVREKVFNDINLSQSWKIFCGTNAIFREIFWFYPSLNSDENDRYVVYNYEEQVWYFGSIERTAWIDRGIEDLPRGAGVDGYLYTHETGSDDGSVTPPASISSFIESSPIELSSEEIGDGYHFALLRRIIPDITFVGSTAETPVVTYSIMPRNYPGGSFSSTKSGNVSKVVSVTVEEWTETVPMRARGRHFILRVDSDQEGASWRLGLQRFEIQPDGLR